MILGEAPSPLDFTPEQSLGGYTLGTFKHLILQSRQTWRDWAMQAHHNDITPVRFSMYKRVKSSVSTHTGEKGN